MSDKRSGEGRLVIRGHGMTREQAIKRIGSALTVEALVDAYVDMGILKLEEPKSPDPVADLAVELRAMGWLVPVRALESALEDAGLRIVDDGERG